MTHWKKYFDYRFISAEELDGKEVIMTIAGIDRDEVYSQSNRAKEKKATLSFKETDKKIVLNKTNAKKITEVLGTPHVEKWIGQKITLYPTSVQGFGSNVDAIRIKKAPAGAVASKPELKQIEFDNQPMEMKS